jgi:hypothetical protein
MGNAVKTERKDGKVVLPLMSTPVYLTSAKLSPEALAEKLSSAAVSGTVDCAPRAGLGNFQGRPAMIARVENPRPSAVDSVALRGSASGCLSLPGGAETVLTQIPGGGAGEVFFSLCVSPGRGSLELAAALEGAIYSARKNDILCGVFRRAAAGRPPREAISLDDPAQIIERVRPDGQKPLAEKYSKLKTPSAKIFAAWTETSLSLKAEVKDNFIKTSPPGSELYQGDCVEFYFDFVPEKTFARLPEYGDFCLKLAAAPAEKGDTPRLVMEKNGRTVTDFALFNIADVKANSELTENGYIIELAIPLRNIKLTAGSVIGFNAQLISSGEKKEDKFHLMWNGKDCWNAPGDFGVILLSE